MWLEADAYPNRGCDLLGWHELPADHPSSLTSLVIMDFFSANPSSSLLPQTAGDAASNPLEAGSFGMASGLVQADEASALFSSSLPGLDTLNLDAMQRSDGNQQAALRTDSRDLLTGAELHLPAVSSCDVATLNQPQSSALSGTFSIQSSTETLPNPNRFRVQRWATQQGEFLTTQKWITGDFNDDGRDDVAKSFNDVGRASIDVHVSNGLSLTRQRWATQQGNFLDAQKWVAADFNGDGRDDVAKVFNDGGLASIDVHLSGSSGFAIQRWATQQGGFWDAQKWVVGDFNGDGRDDLAKAFDDGGFSSIDVHLSTGSGLMMQRWATRQGGFADDQKWMAGDFNGDGRDDLAKGFNDGGLASADVYLAGNRTFTPQRWLTQQGSYQVTQKWDAGDFNGDGRDDIAAVYNDSGLASINVFSSTGSSLIRQRWATQQGSFADAQQWRVGDFNADGRDDLAKIYADSGLATIDVYASANLNYNSTTGYGEASAERAIERLLNVSLPDLPNQFTGGYYGIDRIGAPEAWNSNYTGQGIVVAVCDTGVDRTHFDLDANIWTNSREIAGNGRDDDGNGYIDDVNGWDFIGNTNNTMDIHGHGTHVAGTIAAERNAFGATGIAYNAKIMPVKVLSNSGSGTWASVANGIRYAADNGANVINISLGGSSGDPMLQSAVEYAWNKGAAVIMAAGNNAGSSPIFPAAYADKWGIAVGAVNNTGALASFSNRAGTSGLDYVTSAGVMVTSTTPNNGYSTWNGTSMATPHVAGAMALLMQANRSSGRNLALPKLEHLFTSTALNSSTATISLASPDFGLSGGSQVEAMNRSDRAQAISSTGHFSEDGLMSSQSIAKRSPDTADHELTSATGSTAPADAWADALLALASKNQPAFPSWDLFQSSSGGSAVAEPIGPDWLTGLRHVLGVGSLTPVSA